MRVLHVGPADGLDVAVEIAVTMTNQGLKTGIGVFFFLVALIFVYRSFYCMRIPEEDAGTNGTLVLPHNIHGDKIPAERTEGELVAKR